MQATSDGYLHGARRLPGSRVVLFVFGAAAAIGGLVIMMGVLSGGSADEDLICKPDPTVCAAVREYAEAFNSGDAPAVRALVSEQFMRVRLDSESDAQLRARLAALTDEQRLEDFRITVISAAEDEAFVTARFTVDGFETESKFALINRGGRWLIDR